MGYRNLEKFVNGYRNLAVTLMNTLVAILIVNLVLSIIFMVRDRSPDNPVESIYGGSVLREVYPGMSASEIDDLLAETWSRPYIYQPFTQFRERTFAGSYINVSAEGYRLSREQGPWPPAEDSLNVFLFGGSTTFGYGVSDDQTIASYLQPFLAEGLNRDVRVYNFGQGHYYSTQERIQFTELLASGAVPDVALFIDGLNDFYFAFDEPLFTERFRNFVSGNRCAECSRTFWAETSIGRLANGLSRRLSGISADDQTFAQKTNVEYTEPERQKYGDSQVLGAVIDRYLENRRLIGEIANASGVIPIFVWQPVPNHAYDEKYHLFSAGGYGRISSAGFGYDMMSERLKHHDLGTNFLWIAHLQLEEKKPLYVDKVHYSAYFSEKIAREISNQILEKSLLARI